MDSKELREKINLLKEECDQKINLLWEEYHRKVDLLIINTLKAETGETKVGQKTK